MDNSTCCKSPIAEILGRRRRNSNGLLKPSGVEKWGAENHLNQGLIGCEVSLRLRESNHRVGAASLADSSRIVRVWADHGPLNIGVPGIRHVEQRRDGDCPRMSDEAWLPLAAGVTYKHPALACPRVGWDRCHEHRSSRRTADQSKKSWHCRGSTPVHHLARAVSRPARTAPLQCSLRPVSAGSKGKSGMLARLTRCGRKCTGVLCIQTGECGW